MKALIAVLFLVIFIQPVWAKYEDSMSWNLDSKGVKELRIDIPCGAIEVKTNDSLKEIRITAEIVIRKLSEKDAEEYVKNWKVDLVKNGDVASFVYNGKNKKNTRFSKKNISVEFDLVVEMPKNMNLTIDTGAGNIKIADLIGDIKLESGAGNISVTNVNGNIDVNTGAGNMRFKKITGNVDADSGAGNMTFFDIKGDIAADCGAGNISIETCNGYIDVDTGIGNIDISGVSKKVKANTGLGKCTIDDEV